jgi:hypothetical protein
MFSIQNLVSTLVKKIGNLITPSNKLGVKLASKGLQEIKNLAETDNSNHKVLVEAECANPQNQITFTDQFTQGKYEAHIMYNPNGTERQLHLVNADTRKASVIDEKEIKKLAKNRGKIATRLNSSTYSREFVSQKNYDKKSAAVKYVEKSSLHDCFTNKNSAEMYSTLTRTETSISPNDVFSSKSYKQAWEKKTKKSRNYSGFFYTHSTHMSKKGLSVNYLEETHKETSSSSKMSLESFSRGQSHVWDDMGYTSSITSSEYREKMDAKKSSRSTSSHTRELIKSSSTDGAISVKISEVHENNLYTLKKEENISEWSVTSVNDDGNVFSVETEDGGVHTIVDKSGKRSGFYSISECFSNTGEAHFSWNIGCYTKNENKIERSSFSATGYWSDFEDSNTFSYTLSFENYIENSKSGTASSSLFCLEGDDFQEFKVYTEALNLGTPQFQLLTEKSTSKN